MVADPGESQYWGTSRVDGGKGFTLLGGGVEGVADDLA